MERYNLQINEDHWFKSHNVLKFSHKAMATIFEIFMVHEDRIYAVQSAYAAFAELDRLEQELSCYIENSDISRINSLAKNEVTTVGLDAFVCLQECKILYDETKGIFDITSGPLIDFWRHRDRLKDADIISQRDIPVNCVGLDRLQLIDKHYQICLVDDCVKLDLGGYGKGYAVDKMAAVLKEWDVVRALIHGGQSTVLALEGPVGENGWQVTLSNPHNAYEIIDKIYLRNISLSASGIQKGTHIINPKTGYPVQDKLSVWTKVTSAALSDALSTSFFIMPIPDVEKYIENHRGVSAKILTASSSHNNKGENILTFGQW